VFIPMDALSFLGILIGISGVALNLKLAHMTGQWFQKVS